MDFQEHLRSHYNYKCLKCDYTSRTEGRLRRHLKDFHSDVPPDNFSGKSLKPVRMKIHRCKQCDFMTEQKVIYLINLIKIIVNNLNLNFKIFIGFF